MEKERQLASINLQRINKKRLDNWHLWHSVGNSCFGLLHSKCGTEKPPTWNMSKKEIAKEKQM